MCGFWGPPLLDDGLGLYFSRVVRFRGFGNEGRKEWVVVSLGTKKHGASRAEFTTTTTILSPFKQTKKFMGRREQDEQQAI
jgi:hypothetical protein